MAENATVERLPDGVRVRVSSPHFKEKCEGVVRDACYDEGWMYRIEVTSGDDPVMARESNGELWLLDSEVHRID